VYVPSYGEHVGRKTPGTKRRQRPIDSGAVVCEGQEEVEIDTACKNCFVTKVEPVTTFSTTSLQTHVPREDDAVTAEHQAQLSEHLMASCGMKAVELASIAIPTVLSRGKIPGFRLCTCVCTLKHALSESIAKVLLEAGANANRWWWCASPPFLPFPSLPFGLDLL